MGRVGKYISEKKNIQELKKSSPHTRMQKLYAQEPDRDYRSP